MSASPTTRGCRSGCRSTPRRPAERDEQVEQVSRLPPNLRQLADFVRYLWVFYVAGFNADRQEQLLYGPIRALVEEARAGVRDHGTGPDAGAAMADRLPQPDGVLQRQGVRRLVRW